MVKFLNELSFTEFDQLIQNYIDQPEPSALTLDVFQLLIDESNQPVVEITDHREQQRLTAPSSGKVGLVDQMSEYNLPGRLYSKPPSSD